MISDNVFAHMANEIKGQIDYLKDNVCSGACVDYAMYRECIGKISSLELMLGYVKDLERRALEEE